MQHSISSGMSQRKPPEICRLATAPATTRQWLTKMMRLDRSLDIRILRCATMRTQKWKIHYRCHGEHFTANLANRVFLPSRSVVHRGHPDGAIALLGKCGVVNDERAVRGEVQCVLNSEMLSCLVVARTI